ncbi:MAG: hypothetical protein SynsKO_20730 [Synoicihabitans sp.]
MKNYYKNYLTVHNIALANLEITDRGGASLEIEDAFDKLCELSVSIRETGRKKYLIGNGASAAFANHMALDWTKNGGVPTHSFSDSALLTALGNDLGYEEAFAAPLRWYAKDGDLLVTISSSGNSPNIIKTIEVAREKALGVVTVSGLKPDNASRKLGDLNLYIPARTYGIVECAHQVLLHVWLDKFMGITEWKREGFQNMNNKDFSL